MSKNLLAATSIIIGATVLISFPALAGLRYVSKTGNLLVQYGDKCSTVNPSGVYKFGNGVTGLLTALDCESTGGDIASHKFIDTAGSERCFGRMTQYWSGKVITVWKIDGTVPGYRCSKAGKTFDFEMDYPPREY